MNGTDLARRSTIATASGLQAHWFAAPLAAAISPWRACTSGSTPTGGFAIGAPTIILAMCGLRLHFAA